ncbi:glycosyltransferase [Niabella sp. CC-SYL272]|uniref:glycosyltransferase n=1 Tax=Niabella agricola TaxID=2891571 RepID=UPI001F3DD5B1|nr:glycosyltransferase [Niabella agricola]MCF3111124.1 glycosyltransferase [Niabella agricola]
MHYGIITFGSRGDVQPYIALALELKEQGNSVSIVGNENFSDFVPQYGIPFYPLPVDSQKILQSPEIAGILKSGNVITYLRELGKIIRKGQRAVLENMVHYCENFEVLIATPLTVAWVFSVAERLKKPWAIVQLTVPSVPTAVFPYLGLDFFNAPIYNRFTYRLMRWLFWKEHKKDVQEQRALLKLPPLEEPLPKKIDEQQVLQLHAFSRFLLERPADWPQEADITGFLDLKAGKEAGTTDAITRWLERGTPPIYIGFGSFPVPDPAIFYGILEHLLNQTDERYIFCQGWSEATALPKSERLFEVKAVDHAWLFPQCKLVVVHGGIGTVGAGLRAKIPVVVVSVLGDQPIWGRFVKRKGWGAHLPFKKLTAQKLLDAIRAADQDAIRASVLKVGRLMEAENGAAEAASRLEAYFKIPVQPIRMPASV